MHELRTSRSLRHTGLHWIENADRTCGIVPFDRNPGLQTLRARISEHFFDHENIWRLTVSIYEC
jgi:hypothetical protein